MARIRLILDAVGGGVKDMEKGVRRRFAGGGDAGGTDRG